MQSIGLGSLVFCYTVSTTVLFFFKSKIVKHQYALQHILFLYVLSHFLILYSLCPTPFFLYGKFIKVHFKEWCTLTHCNNVPFDFFFFCNKQTLVTINHKYCPDEWGALYITNKMDVIGFCSVKLSCFCMKNKIVAL